MSRHRQRGIALLVAIIMFAIATTVAAAITYDKAMSARRAAASFTLEQALQAGMAAEAAAALLLEDNGSKAATIPTDTWAEPLGPIEIENTGVWIQAQLIDLSGRFNLNSLLEWSQTDNTFVTDPHQYAIFRTLLERLDIDQRYADLMVDWIDPDIAPQAQGGEDTLYLTQVPPFRPPNTFITHASELLALPAMGAEQYARLAPYVAALPRDNPVNVCTASKLVLDVTMNDPATQVMYAADPNFEKNRESTSCYPGKSNYTAGIDPAVRPRVDPRVEDKSSWFQLRTHIRIGTAEFVLYSVLLREGDNKVRAMQRSFGSE
jgi:general secretion pathway protein K